MSKDGGTAHAFETDARNGEGAACIGTALLQCRVDN